MPSHNLVSFIEFECIFNTRSVLGILYRDIGYLVQRIPSCCLFSKQTALLLRIVSKYIRRSIRSSLAFPLPLHQGSRARIHIIKQRSSILWGQKKYLRK